jgi:hypothetical protein
MGGLDGPGRGHQMSRPVHEFQMVRGDRPSAQFETGGSDVAEDLAIHRYLSDCTEAVALLVRTSRGMHSPAVVRQADNRSPDQSLRTPTLGWHEAVLADAWR